MDEVMRVRTPPPPTVMGLVSLQEEERPELTHSSPRRHSKKVAICKPGRGPSSEPNHTGTLTTAFLPPEV